MTSVVIERCVVRVRRTGGWSWGPEPDALVAAATRALPGLLLAHLRTLARAGRAVHARRPIEVRLSIGLPELIAAGRAPAPAGELGTETREALAELGRPLAEQLAQALRDADATQRDEGGDRPVEGPSPATPPALVSGGRPAVLRALVAWHRHGELARALAGFGVEGLEAWHAALVAVPEPATSHADDSLAAQVARIGDAIASRGPPAASGDRLARLRARLSAFAAIADELDLLPTHAAVAAVCDARWPLAPPPGAGRAALRTASDAPIASITPRREDVPGPAPESARVGAPRRVRAEAEVHVSSALPFLLLGPLSCSGWLGALDATLEIGDLREAAPLLATALAYKVLDAPERGWNRSPASREAAAAFAGLAEPAPDPLLHELGRRAGAFTSPLDAALRAPILRGHRAGDGLLLHSREGRHLLFETDGLFPLAIADGAHALAEIVPVAQQAGDAPLVVSAAAAAPETLDRLELANLRFVTAAPPARGEVWRRLEVGGQRFFTNDGVTPAGRLAALAQDAEALVLLADEADEALVAERPTLPLAPPGSLAHRLEHTFALVAGAALAQLAHTLFAARETASPVLALTRFRDLDARVRFASDGVRVHIPLGRRHADLLTHGLLGSVADVPWLPGRVVEVKGG